MNKYDLVVVVNKRPLCDCCPLLEVAGVLAEGQVEGLQSWLGVFLGTQQQRQQVQGVNVVPAERQSDLQGLHGC